MRRYVIEVDMYPLQVERQLDPWDELGQRHRHWAALPEARRLISEKDLVQVMNLIAAQARHEGTQATPQRRSA